MRQERLVFVPTAADVPPPDPGAGVVVLDTAWTPGAGERLDVRSVRPSVSAVLERHDLFHEALDRLDAWAEDASLADRMTVDGVSWWYRVRPSIVDFLHERLLWCYVLADVLSSGAVRVLTVPAGETALVHVATASTVLDLDVRIAPNAEAGRPTPITATPPATAGGGRAWLARWQSRRQRRELDERTRLLEARLASLSGADRRVLVITQPRIFQAVRLTSGERLIDPQLEPVLDGLERKGVQPIVIGLELDHRTDADWSILRNEARLVPQSLVNSRWPARDEPPGDAAAVGERLGAALSVPFVVEGLDLAPILVAELRRYGGSWLGSQTRTAVRAERMMGDLRPHAMFLNHEGIRTPWLAAAKRAGVPVFAVQHGLIYERHAVYSHRRRDGLLVPECTFTFGSFERDVLLEYGRYAPHEVDVSGSPRLDLDRAGRPDAGATDAERAATRRGLGVAPDALMLVVSTAHTALFQRFYLPHMLDRILGGPLPGVHVVFKQHPGERDAGPYRAILEGMASARGYAPPSITVIRDIDLYRLLRAADAHLGLHSTVLTDAIAAGTPNLISAAQAYGDLLGYVAAGVARPVRDVDELRTALAHPRAAAEPARQAFLEAHFRPGDASGRIADAIAQAIERGRVTVGGSIA